MVNPAVEWILSLRVMFFLCVITVWTLMHSTSAISLLLNPLTICTSTSRSRSLSSSPSEGVSGVCVAGWLMLVSAGRRISSSIAQWSAKSCSVCQRSLITLISVYVTVPCWDVLCDGKYLIITSDGVVGAYDSLTEGYEVALKTYGKGNFMLQLCSEGEKDYSQRFRTSRVVF